MANLFRPEVLENRQRDWLGSIQLIRPASLGLLTAFVAAVAVAVAVFLVLGQYTRKARVTGYLVPDRGVIRLVAPQTATVVESHVAEGRAVHSGDVLFVLSVGQATLSGDTQATVQRSLAARQQSLQGAARQRGELERAQLTSIDRQLADMNRELASLASEADLQRQRLTLAQQAQTRLESLRADNFVSAAQVQTKAEDILGLKAGLQSLDRQRAAQLREIAALESQRRELPLRSQEQQGEIVRDLAALAQQSAENEARQRIVVRAPQDGLVTGVMAEPGQSVSSAVALASLLPADARLQAHLFAPSSAVGFVRTHQPVLVRYQAFPYQKFGSQAGEVAQVSRSPLQPTELAGLQLPGASNVAEPLYRITVTLDQQTVKAYGQAQPLAPGMQLEADVMLDRRRLIEWIFEPVLGLVGRV
ncbi:HlyD family efflux transporter periplasmic adaptor subunit [soil metagenome]